MRCSLLALAGSLGPSRAEVASPPCGRGHVMVTVSAAAVASASGAHSLRVSSTRGRHQWSGKTIFCSHANLVFQLCMSQQGALHWLPNCEDTCIEASDACFTTIGTVPKHPWPLGPHTRAHRGVSGWELGVEARERCCVPQRKNEGHGKLHVLPDLQGSWRNCAPR